MRLIFGNHSVIVVLMVSQAGIALVSQLSLYRSPINLGLALVEFSGLLVLKTDKC